MAIIEKEISWQAGGAQIPALFCKPDDQGPFGVVIVLHGSDGFKPNHAAVARQLAEAGFASLESKAVSVLRNWRKEWVAILSALANREKAVLLPRLSH